MKDHLENFVSEHRNEFEVYTPSPEIWERISKAGSGRKTSRIRMLRIVSGIAASVLLFTASWMLNDYLDRDKQADNVYLISPELREAEVYYTRMLGQKYDELQPYFSSFPGLKEQVKADLGELDNAYNNLRKDLSDNIANEEVIEAMIQNYRLKLSILEEMLNELRKDSNDENQSQNEKSI